MARHVQLWDVDVGDPCWPGFPQPLGGAFGAINDARRADVASTPKHRFGESGIAIASRTDHDGLEPGVNRSLKNSGLWLPREGVDP